MGDPRRDLRAFAGPSWVDDELALFLHELFATAFAVDVADFRLEFRSDGADFFSFFHSRLRGRREVLDAGPPVSSELLIKGALRAASSLSLVVVPLH